MLKVCNMVYIFRFRKLHITTQETNEDNIKMDPEEIVHGVKYGTNSSTLR
jgi:hypothetical protein